SLPFLRAPAVAMSAVTERLRGAVRPWITVHPFGSTTAQWWPRASAESAARALRERVGGTVLLAGGNPMESSPREMVDLAGKLALDKLIALVRLSVRVLSRD